MSVTTLPEVKGFSAEDVQKILAAAAAQEEAHKAAKATEAEESAKATAKVLRAVVHAIRQSGVPSKTFTGNGKWSGATGYSLSSTVEVDGVTYKAQVLICDTATIK